MHQLRGTRQKHGGGRRREEEACSFGSARTQAASTTDDSLKFGTPLMGPDGTYKVHPSFEKEPSSARPAPPHVPSGSLPLREDGRKIGTNTIGTGQGTKTNTGSSTARPTTLPSSTVVLPALHPPRPPQRAPIDQAPTHYNDNGDPRWGGATQKRGWRLILDQPEDHTTETGTATKQQDATHALISTQASDAAYRSMELAKLQRQIFALCQKILHVNPPYYETVDHDLAAGPLMEVIVKENDQIIWHSSSAVPEEQGKTASGGVGAEDYRLVEAVETIDDDMKGIRRRAHRSFQKTVEVFKMKIREQQKVIDSLRDEIRSKEHGGVKYISLQADLESARYHISQQDTKIKSLIKLLDRAGATIKQQEENKHSELVASANRNLSGEEGLDWSPLMTVMKDLIIEDRTPQGIVRDVCEFLEQQQSRISDLDASTEMYAEKFAEKEALSEMLKREREKLNIDNLLSKQTIRQLQQQLKETGEEKEKVESTLRTKEAEFSEERHKLFTQLHEAEEAIRQAVSCKPYFIGLGKGPLVAPFLRYEGKIKNLEFPKTEVESIINSIWATRDPGAQVELRKGHSMNARSLEKALERTILRKIAPTAKLHIMVEDGMADYNNLRNAEFSDDFFAINFSEHTTRYLIEHYGGDKAAKILEKSEKSESSSGRGRRGSQMGTFTAFRSSTSTFAGRQGMTMPSSVAEVAYSLIEGCEKYKYDADVELFRRVVKWEIPELSFFDQMAMLMKLRAAFIACAAFGLNAVTRDEEAPSTEVTLSSDLSSSAERSQTQISFREIMAVVSSFFPAKSQEQFAQVRAALRLEADELRSKKPAVKAAQAATEGQSTKTLSDEDYYDKVVFNIQSLFASNEQGNQGPFVECIRDQHLDDVCMYVNEIQDSISSAGQTSENGYAPVETISKSLQRVDPMKPPEEVNEYLLALLRQHPEVFAESDQSPKNVISPSSEKVTIPLHALVDCEKLAPKSRLVFSKRYGPRMTPKQTGADE